MLKPLNRHLLVEKVEVEEKEAKSTILVPDGYKIKKSPHALYKVKDIAPDCEKVDLAVDTTVVVNESMVEKISVGGETYHIILENYIFAVYDNLSRNSKWAAKKLCERDD